MEMYFEIEEEYKQFLEDIKDNGFIFGAYMDESEYEDEYSHNAIDEAMGELQKKMRAYLHEHRPNEFIVLSDYCVRVLTVDKAKQLNVSDRTIELRLVR